MARTKRAGYVAEERAKEPTKFYVRKKYKKTETENVIDVDELETPPEKICRQGSTSRRKRVKTRSVTASSKHSRGTVEDKVISDDKEDDGGKKKKIASKKEPTAATGTKRKSQDTWEANKGEEKKRKKVKEVCKGDDKKDDDTNKVQKKSSFRSIHPRCSPHALYVAIKSMNEDQLDCIINNGFGSLIQMKTDEIPSKIGYFAVKAFSYEKMLIEVENGVIPVTKHSVHDVFGLPMGPIDIESLPYRDKEEDDADWYDGWKEQFKKNLKTITPNDLIVAIIKRKEADMIFLANFIVLMCSSLGTCNKMGSCTQQALNYISKKTKIADIDWCSYILKLARTTREVWNPDDLKASFLGPSAMLTLLYVDSTECGELNVKRVRPVANYLTSEYLKYRESLEIESGCFEKVTIRDTLEEERKLWMESGNRNFIHEEINRLSLRINDSLIKNPEDRLYVDLKKVFDELLYADDGDERDVQNRGVHEGTSGGNKVQVGGVNEIDEVEKSGGEQDVPVTEKDGSVHIDEVEKGGGEQDEEAVSVQEKGGGDEETADCSDDKFKTPDGAENKCGGVPNVVVDGPELSQYWSDPIVHEEVDKTVDTFERRKTVVVEGIPSFSLGMTQEFAMAGAGSSKNGEGTGPKNGVESVVDDVAGEEINVGLEDINEMQKSSEDEQIIVAPLRPTPLQVILDRMADVPVGNRPKRAKKLGPSLKSPYVDRETDMKEMSDEMEGRVALYCFSMCCAIDKVIFKTKSGQLGKMGHFVSLRPHEQLFSTTIDCFVEYLNHMEKYRSNDSKSRFFFKTNVAYAGYLESDMEDDEAYRMFHDNVVDSLRVDDYVEDVRNYDLMFFPIVRKEHIYCYCFEVAKTSCYIIDNRIYSRKEEKDFLVVSEKLRRYFVRYLMSVYHDEGADFWYKFEPKRLPLRWRTKENHDDCGVFTMRHMETFHGVGPGLFTPGFRSEGEEQKKQLVILRFKYCHKILTSQINELRSWLYDNLTVYDRIPADTRREMFRSSGGENVKQRLEQWT